MRELLQSCLGVRDANRAEHTGGLGQFLGLRRPRSVLNVHHLLTDRQNRMWVCIDPETRWKYRPPQIPHFAFGELQKVIAFETHLTLTEPGVWRGQPQDR